MAFIFPEEKKKRSSNELLLRPNSSKGHGNSSIRSSLGSMQTLMDIPEAGLPLEPLTLNINQRQKHTKVQLIMVRDCSYETTESESSQEYWHSDMKTRVSCQFKKPGHVARSQTIGRTTTEAKHERFVSGSSVTDVEDVVEREDRVAPRAASCTIIKSPVDEKGNALRFKKPLPRQHYCDEFLGSWYKELGHGPVRRILSTGEVLDFNGRLKYVVKFLSPIRFRIPQSSGRGITATLKNDGLYLQLDNGEIWVKKEHMFAFGMHRVDTMKCCFIL